jgi:phospholipid/cholesterol/gamma-HCH transport system permease protein
MPRAVSMALCVLSLTVVFVVASFATGYFCGALLGTGPDSPGIFARSVIRGVEPGDFLNLIAKTLIPGLMSAVIACMEGLSVEGVATDIPQAVTRTVVRSTLGLLIVSVVISVLTYA